jgi:hypothetical protein
MHVHDACLDYRARLSEVSFMCTCLVIVPVDCLLYNDRQTLFRGLLVRSDPLSNGTRCRAPRWGVPTQLLFGNGLGPLPPFCRAELPNRSLRSDMEFLEIGRKIMGSQWNEVVTSTGTQKKNKKKTKSGTRPTPTGLRPQHPGWGETNGGNAQQRETQAAAQELTESDARAQKRTHTSPQAQCRPPQKRQPREQRRQ